MSKAFAINDSGQVVGSSTLSDGTDQAFLWQDDTISAIQSPDEFLTVSSINNAGQVVGTFFSTATSSGHAFLWQSGIGSIDLGGRVQRTAEVNDDGVAVGSGYPNTLANPRGSPPNAMRWINNSPQFLFVNDSGSGATGINSLGWIVGGKVKPSQGRTVGFLWVSNTETDIDAMSSAADIDDINEVVGTGFPLETHAILWQNGNLTDLGEFVPHALNNFGEVVGGDTRAILYEDDSPHDLNSLSDTSGGWVLNCAYDINDGGQIVGYGLHHGQIRAFLLDPHVLAVTRPPLNALEIAGEIDMIRWMAPRGLQLRVEFSDDDGATYSTVETNLVSDSNYYAWEVPPALSRKCRVKIVDINDDSTYAVSEQFKVKGYQLTRFRSDSSYEAFRPDLNGWSFENTNLVMWPPTWWIQFNYQTGTDSVTGHPYPAIDPFLSARAYDFPDWPLFVKAFGVGQCYMSTVPAVYRPTATLKWRDIKESWDGSCSGFSLTSLWDFSFEEAFLDSFAIGTYVNLYDLPINVFRRTVVDQVQSYQLGREHEAYRRLQYNKTPQQVLEQLKEMLLPEVSDAGYLHIEDATSAHALVPYHLERIGLAPGEFNLYVYDSNHPGDTNRTVFIDSVNNYWGYNDLGWGGDRGMYLMDPVSTYFQHPTLRGSTPALPPISATGQSYVEMYTSTQSSIVIRNAAGDSIGFRDSTTFNTIADAIPLVPPTSRYQPPIGYNVPAAEYRVLVNAFTDSVTHSSMFSDSVVYDYQRRDVQSSQTDRLILGPNGIGLQNPDNQQKANDFKTIVIESAVEKVIDILDYTMNQNDSAFYGAVDHDKLRLVNIGGQKQYTLRPENAMPGADPQFLRDAVTIPANSSEQIAPAWSNLGQEVAIYVDLGNDGIIDDTLLIGNTLGVGERGIPQIPKEFSLAQNYPNPFNPTTIIEYALPQPGHVTLSVYNTLGQLVATLVDDDRPAGRFTAQWTPASFSSGVYFYRIDATPADGKQTFTSVKKMLMLK